MERIEKEIEIPEMSVLATIFGFFDKNIKIIMEEWPVQILLRDHKVKITGFTGDVKKVSTLIERLQEMVQNGQEVNEQTIRYRIELLKDDKPNESTDFEQKSLFVTPRGKNIQVKTLGQEEYIKTIQQKDIVFGIGPAGTGKTFLAVLMAVKAFKNKAVNRIILTRPAVEAGEKLGYLPGDLQDKVDPYLRPLYDSLQELMGGESYLKHIERGNIEIAPLAYMRGRTLDDSFIILDEAQNTTGLQMKMFLTRIGFGSKVVVTGDLTQIDLPKEKRSGLKEAVEVLNGISDIGIVHLNQKDVVRHTIVKKILDAYECFEKRSDEMGD